jgi:hypothetical protein
MKAELKLVVDNQPVKKKDRKKQSKKAELKLVVNNQPVKKDWKEQAKKMEYRDFRQALRSAREKEE